MKIHGNKPPESLGIKLDIQKISSQNAGTAPEQAARTGPSDKVDISAKGKEVAELMSAINQLPEVRNDKVKAVKEAIDSGNYNIDPMKIAGKILSEI